MTRLPLDPDAWLAEMERRHRRSRRALLLLAAVCWPGALALVVALERLSHG